MTYSKKYGFKKKKPTEHTTGWSNAWFFWKYVVFWKYAPTVFIDSSKDFHKVSQPITTS